MALNAPMMAYNRMLGDGVCLHIWWRHLLLAVFFEGEDQLLRYARFKLCSARATFEGFFEVPTWCLERCLLFFLFQKTLQVFHTHHLSCLHL